MMIDAPSPSDFFKHLLWLDGRPLPEVIESYRSRIFEDVLYSFDDSGWPQYNLTLCGRGKKNWKSADLILAGLYRFLAWPSQSGNDCFVLANDEGQAGDDLQLLKKIIEVNPILKREVEVRSKSIHRLDEKGVFQILPAKDISGSHGKTYLFIGFDEIHGYKNFDILEALSPDPTRRDVLTWITSYETISASAKVPLSVLKASGKAGADPKMYFSWYSGAYCTDPEAANLPTAEERANPSLASWQNPFYLAQQKLRLPTHKYRRLHLNEPGAADGVFFNADKYLACVVTGRKALLREEKIRYNAFVDMSGGSVDEAVLSVGHRAPDGRLILDRIECQAGRPPFNPRNAIVKFVGILKEYGINRVTGDNYAGETFKRDFLDLGVTYIPCKQPKSDLYEALEPQVNAGMVELLDQEELTAQALTLVWRGSKVDHQNGDHDDQINSAAGVLVGISKNDIAPSVGPGGGTQVSVHNPMSGRTPQSEEMPWLWSGPESGPSADGSYSLKDYLGG